MVINGSIAQIRSTHSIEFCMNWFGKAPRRRSQIRDNCQAVDGTSDSVDGKPSHAAEVTACRFNLDCLAFELASARERETKNCCGCCDDPCARTPIAASTKRPSQL